jgi:ribosomal protein L3 glutamine methyltransferase
MHSKISDILTELEELLDREHLYYGHGTSSARDEALAMVLSVFDLNYPLDNDLLAILPSSQQWLDLNELLSQRILNKIPLPYLTNEAYFCDHKFFVDDRVLIPRSPIAELIKNNLEPWININRVKRVLEIGTGSGCIALSMAKQFPHLEIVATDISAPALEVAKINTKAMKLDNRVKLIQADLFTNLSGCFDLIISNPPYVAQEIFENLPTEYSYEPQEALVAGENGLDFISRILQDASPFLNDDGVLIIEAGVASTEVERVYSLPIKWIRFEHGGEGVALIEAKHLE